MRLLLIGPPGSGKGTQGQRLADRYGVEHIAAGDLIARRLQVFNDATAPALDFYRERGMLIEIDGTQDPAAVQADICASLPPLVRAAPVST